MRQVRGSPRQGVPSGASTVHTTRATSGDTATSVDRSGSRRMSDSNERAEPSSAEPSKPAPSGSASSNLDAGRASALLVQNTSTNASRTQATDGRGEELIGTPP